MPDPNDDIVKRYYKTVCKETKSEGLLVAPENLDSTALQYTINQSVPAVVGEMASILVEIAVKKAKVSGLEVVRIKTRDAVCGLKNPWDNHVLLPATCQLISQVSLERLAGTPDAVYTALMNDLLGGLASAPIDQLAATNARSLLRTALAMTRTALARSPAAFAPSDAWALLGSVLETFEVDAAVDAEGKAASAAVAALSACVKLLRADAPSCDPVVLVKAAIDSRDIKADYDLSRLVAIVSEGIKVLAGGADGKADVMARLRFRDAVEVVFAIAEPFVAEGSHLDLVRQLVLAALDGNVATIVTAAAELVTVKITDEKEVAALRKVNLVVTAVGAYAETFSKPLGAPLTSDDRAKLRAARTEILENLVEAATVRTDRNRDVVWSLGMPVGFLGGLQWVRKEDGVAGAQGTSLSGSQWMAPQLELPLGVAVQWLPGKDCWFGLHAMVLALDLGQFASYDREGESTEASWNTILSPGAQAGIIFGSPSNAFVFGLEMRYAPTLFEGNGKGTANVLAGGALRFGGFLSYYVPFFDFN